MLPNSLTIASGDALLATKFYMPQSRAKLVSRPHLLERLEAGLGGKLTLVCAPAGFGKTTSLSEWLFKSQRSTAWLSLEKADNDTVRFLDYLIAALQTIHVDVEGVRALLKLPQLPPFETILTRLINALGYDAVPLNLVLDDYHVIKTRAIHEAVEFLLEHLPPSLHVVIASRTDPPLPLARLRVRGELSELREADLRFNNEEVSTFFREVRGLELPPEDIALLETRTEGWIAGLQLAALSLKDRQNSSAFIRAFTGSNRYIGSYLLGEVLNRQPEAVQRFLLQTSLLEKLSVPLCNAVTGREDSGAMLEFLEQNNLFIFALDDERNWYRYHHLFADVLGARLQQLEPQRVSELHRRASRWFSEHGFIHDAVKHALATKDYALITMLMEPATTQLAARGDVSTIRTWLELLPTEVIQHHIVLTLFKIWICILDNETERTDEWIQHCKRLLAEGGSLSEAQRSDHEGTLAGMIAQHELAQQNYAEAKRQALRAMSLVLPASPMRGAVALVLGHVARYAGELEEALEAYKAAEKNGHDTGHLLLEYVALAFQSVTYRLLGRLTETQTLCERGLRLVTNSEGQAGAMAGLFYLELSWLALERGDFERAEHYALEVMNPERGLIIFGGLLYDCHSILAHLRAAQERFDEAFQEADEALHHYRGVRGSGPKRSVELAKISWALAQGDTNLARQLWQQAVETNYVSASFSVVIVDDLEHLIQIRFHLVNHESREALRDLATFIPQLETGGRIPRLIEALILQAMAFAGQGQTAEANRALERALKLAQPEGFVRVFVSEGKRLAQLLSRLELSDAKLVAYQKQLLNVFREPVIPTVATNGNSIQDLSSRELEVLRLMAGGQSDKEIAKALSLSVNTVKWYARVIYGKLGVVKRGTAVVKAKELGLF